MDIPHKQNRPLFNLNDFKNWLSHEEKLSDFFDISNRGEKVDEAVGKEVEARVSSKKLIDKMEVEEGEPEDLIDDLIENGGLVISSKLKSYLIEVESGSFHIPKFCVSIKED